MSPEVFDGRGRINELSDIYSLAVLMCEMLSGADSIWSSYCHAAQVRKKKCLVYT
jgi:serine/threonine protein kinase